MWGEFFTFLRYFNSLRRHFERYEGQKMALLDKKMTNYGDNYRKCVYFCIFSF